MIHPIEINKYPITAYFNSKNCNLWGFNRNCEHLAVDYGTPLNTPFNAIDNGIIEWTGDNADGRGIVLKHDNGFRSYYWHINKAIVSIGQRVIKGQQIGLTGNTGRTTGAHIHVGLKNQNGVLVNLLDYLEKNDNNQGMNNDEIVIVQAGWGLWHITQAVGLPSNENTYQQIYELNKGWRGSTDWRSLNARMGTGDKIRVRESSKVETPDPLLTLQSEIKNLQNSLQESIRKNQESQNNIATLQSDLEIAQNEVKSLIQEKQEKENALQEVIKDMQIIKDDKDIINQEIPQTQAGNEVKMINLDSWTFTPSQEKGIHYLYAKFSIFFMRYW